MGGYVALGLAAEHPNRIKKVVTLGTKIDWSPEVAASMSRMFDPEKIQAKVPAFANLLAQAHAPADWKKVCQYTDRRFCTISVMVLNCLKLLLLKLLVRLLLVGAH